MRRRTRRRVGRWSVAAVSLMAGPLAVTWGSNAALNPYTPMQLAAVSCANQHATLHTAPDSLIVDGLDPSCNGQLVRVTVLSKDHQTQSTISEKLVSDVGTKHFRLKLPHWVADSQAAVISLTPIVV